MINLYDNFNENIKEFDEQQHVNAFPLDEKDRFFVETFNSNIEGY